MATEIIELILDELSIMFQGYDTYLSFYFLSNMH